MNNCKCVLITPTPFGLSEPPERVFLLAFQRGDYKAYAAYQQRTAKGKLLRNCLLACLNLGTAEQLIQAEKSYRGTRPVVKTLDEALDIAKAKDMDCVGFWEAGKETRVMYVR